MRTQGTMFKCDHCNISIFISNYDLQTFKPSQLFYHVIVTDKVDIDLCKECFLKVNAFFHGKELKDE